MNDGSSDREAPTSSKSQHDDMTWPREIRTCKVQGPDGYYYEPLWMNPADAQHPIVPGELDRGGAINTITPHKLRRTCPEAFSRPYRADAGLRLERVLEGRE